MEQYEARVADRCEVGKDAVLFEFSRQKMASEMRCLSLKPSYELLDTMLSFTPGFIANSITLSIIGLPSSGILEKTAGIPFKNSRLPFELKTIRRFAMRSKRRMMAYMNGLSEEQRAFAEKQYKSHRHETRQIFVKIALVVITYDHSNFLIR